MTARDTTDGRHRARWLLAASIALTACGGAPASPAASAFDHARHADRDIDCRYCHATVETGAAAGLPAAATCRGCHHAGTSGALAAVAIPANWHRRCWLAPDVRFDHGVHFAAGIGCAGCHVAVERLGNACAVAPMTMSWCLECHRDPELATAEAPTHCSGCHR